MRSSSALCILRKLSVSGRTSNRNATDDLSGSQTSVRTARTGQPPSSSSSFLFARRARGYSAGRLALPQLPVARVFWFSASKMSASMWRSTPQPKCSRPPAAKARMSSTCREPLHQQVDERERAPRRRSPPPGRCRSRSEGRRRGPSVPSISRARPQGFPAWVPDVYSVEDGDEQGEVVAHDGEEVLGHHVVRRGSAQGVAEQGDLIGTLGPGGRPGC